MLADAGIMAEVSIVTYVAILALAFPLISFVILLFFGKRMRTLSAYVSLSATFMSLLCSVSLFMNTLSSGKFSASFDWLAVGTFNIQIGLVVDGLAAVMLLVVSVVSLLVQIYSVAYMADDSRYSRYFAYLSLFTFAMLSLVLASNYLMLFVFWEVVGFTSYLLIGFWYEKESAAKAARKAFIVTKMGDIGLLMGIIILFNLTNTFNMSAIFGYVKSGGLTVSSITLVSLLMFGGPMGKSAQFPLHIWLPDAMEGPTPVSALIHAATMVAAGVYLVGRSFPLFSASPIALSAIAWIGVITSLMAALIAIAATDIKKVLAFSTISKLGAMMMALGVGGYAAGMFHLVTHAFFKALLFLGAGSVIHATHSQNILQMGGLFKKMKVTAVTFIIAALSLAGIPPLSGFWSEDEILQEVYKGGNNLMLVLAMFTVYLTAIYITRLVWLVFFAGSESKKEPHESPPVMLFSLLILAVPAAVIGFAGSHYTDFAFQKFIGAEVGAMHANPMIMWAAVFISLLGIAVTTALYKTRLLTVEDFSSNSFRIFYYLASNKFYLDELFDVFIVKPYTAVCRAFNWCDKNIVDTGMNLVTVIAARGGSVFKKIQNGQVQTYIAVSAAGLLLLALSLIMIFTGR